MSTVRLPQVQYAAIIERTHRQVLTFEWPAGADAVAAWVSPPDQPAESAMTGRAEDITREKYVSQGGMHFRWMLPWRGCAVHVVAVAFTGGRAVQGRPLTLTYPGLLRLRYTVGVARDKAGRRMRLSVQIVAENDNRSAPPLMLVHNPDRLPLHLHDGDPIALFPTGDPAGVGGAPFWPSELVTNPAAVWTADLPVLTGYVRLFVGLEDARQVSVALLDPPRTMLRLDDPQQPAR